MNQGDILQFQVVGRIILGVGSVRQLSQEIRGGAHPLIVTDPGVATSGILKAVTDVLDGAGIKYEAFAEIESDPSVETIDRLATLCREKACALLIGVGGGSSMDAAKATASYLATGGPLEKYQGFHTYPTEPIPVIAIPTTAGTGSEVTAVAVITNHEKKIKMALKSFQIAPKVVILDPGLLASMPAKVASTAGLDALAHAIEAYLSTKASPITDSLAIQAIGMLASSIRPFVANPKNVVAAQSMLVGSTVAGMAFANSGLTVVHSLAHPLGAYYHLPHGLTCAIFLSDALRFNLMACPERFAQIAAALGKDVSDLDERDAGLRAIEAIEELMSDLNVPRHLSELGITFELVDKMVDDALGAAPTTTNPRRVTRQDIVSFFQRIA